MLSTPISRYSSAEAHKLERQGVGTVLAYEPLLVPSIERGLWLTYALSWSACLCNTAVGTLTLRPSRSIPSSVFVSSDQCHGHQYRATVVNVVSKQFDKVRVEQNHCQGLQTLSVSYSSLKMRESAWLRTGFISDAPNLLRMLHTTAHASLLSRP